MAELSELRVDFIEKESTWEGRGDVEVRAGPCAWEDVMMPSFYGRVRGEERKNE